MGRNHPPERTRASRLRHGSLGAILLLCAGFAIAVGGETSNLRITNDTPNILTIVIANRTWKAVAAGASVTYASSDSATVGVTASYAPGQGVTGSAQRSFHLARPNTSQGSYTYIACAVNAPIVPLAPMEWNVTADTLVTNR